MPSKAFLSALQKFIPTQEDRDSYCNLCRDFPKISEAQVLTSIAATHFANGEENYKVAMEVMLCVENLDLMFAATGYAEIANLLIERNKLNLSAEKTSLVKNTIAIFSDESKLYQLGLASYGVYNEIGKLRPLLLEAINPSKKPTFFAIAVPTQTGGADLKENNLAKL